MPNWTNNTINFYGDEAVVNDILKQIKDAIDNDEGIMNHFLPMPEIYTKYDTTNYRWNRFVVGEKSHVMEVETNAGAFVPITITQKFIDEWRAAEEEQSAKYGAIGWYDWCCKYWGTKWDMCDSELNGDTLYCDTAWCAPDAFFKYFTKVLYPGITVVVSSLYEDDWSEYVIDTYRNGEVIDEDFEPNPDYEEEE